MTSDAILPPRHAAFAFVMVTVFLDMLAIGIIMPVLPRLVVDFAGGDIVGGAVWLGVFGTAWALMQFIFSPVQGSLSDRFGRRPLIIGSNIGLGLDYILMALAPNLWWLFIGRLISGITAASFSTAFAYVADVTTPDQRAKKMGLLGVAFGSGFVIGPVLGGLTGAVDPRLPFWIAAGLSLTNAVYGFFVLPESLPSERRSPFVWRRANPLGSLTLVRRSRSLFGLTLVNFLGQVSHCVLPAVSVLYLGYRYGWDERLIGLAIGSVGVGHMIVQGTLIGPMVKHFGERGTLMIGLAFGVAGFVVMGLAESGFVFWLSIPLMSVWGISNAASQALMTRQVGPDEQGQLQGANMSAAGIANMIGPLAFAQTFALSIGLLAGLRLPGLAFLVAAAMLAASAIIAWRTTQPAIRPAAES